MTFCKYIENRIVKIRHEKSDGLFSKTSEHFTLYLFNSGSLVFELNGKPCFLSGNSVICVSSKDEIKMLHQSQADVDCITFAPEFINVNLSWDIVNGDNYRIFCKQHEYPDFKLFLERTTIYNGILPVDEEGYNSFQEYVSLIDKQLSEQSDEKWSCRSRGYLFQMIVLLKFYYKKYISNYRQSDFAWDVCQYINLRLASNLSIEHLSDHFSTNRTTLSEKFKKTTGKTIPEYIKNKRIERITHLLAFTELTTSEIGIQSGYSDQTYLSKLFQKVKGTTPLKYRIDMRNSRPQKSDIKTRGK